MSTDNVTPEGAALSELERQTRQYFGVALESARRCPSVRRM
jgi:hypothetical protein